MVRSTERGALAVTFALLLPVWGVAHAAAGPPATASSYAAARAAVESALSLFPPAAGRLQLKRFQIDAGGPAELDIIPCLVTKVSVYTVLSQVRISCGDLVYAFPLSALHPQSSYLTDGKSFLQLTQTTFTAFGTQATPWYALGDDDKTWRDKLTAPYYTALSNALGVLKSTPPPLADDAQFATVASSYRAATPKPTLPEDAQLHGQQGEVAYDAGQFLDAAEDYERALEAARWWPDGYRNLALSLADSHQYALAIADMQRYLALTPEAPDASDEQDRIDRWKAMAAEARTPSR